MQNGTDLYSSDEMELLVRKAQQGDADSLARLYEHYYARIFRYAFFRTGNRIDAEDVTEDVFLRMLEAINRFKWKGYPFSAWLFKIARNRVVDHYRRKGRQQDIPLETAFNVSDVGRDIDGEMDLKLSIEQVYESMGSLTKLQKEVIALRFASGLSVLETARAIGKKENAVKALQHAAVKKLKAVLMPAYSLSREEQAKPLPQWRECRG